MNYQFLHWLFGWDYIQWQNSCDSGIARVHSDESKMVWYWRYKSTKVADKIRHPDEVLWLTCKPDKYFLESKATR